MLCEKPLATTEADARAVLDAEVALGRRLVQVGFMRRFDPGYVQLKQELTAEGIGEPLVVHNVHRNTSAPYGLVTERTLTNMVVHELDICRWLLDEEYASVMVVAGRPGRSPPTGSTTRSWWCCARRAASWWRSRPSPTPGTATRSSAG